MNRTRIIHLIIALTVVVGAKAQTGVRFTVLHFEQQTKRLQGNWLLGLDRDVSDRTSIGLDVIGGIDLSGGGISEQNQYAGHTVTYNLAQRSIGLQYRSMFFITDQLSGLHIGTQVGFRHITRTLDPYAFPIGSSWGPSPTWARQSTLSDMVFPIGLRLGWRGELDGLYSDLYVSVGTQLGRGGTSTKAPYLIPKDELTGLTIQLGYVIGIGWD